MRFRNTLDRNLYFDTLIDSYVNNDFETCIRMTQQLSQQEERNLLYFMYRNIENPGLFSYILDVIF